MKTKLLGLALVLSLLFSPAFAQDESLLDDESTAADTTGSDDLFGDDFFGDLDSFLEEETTTEESDILEETSASDPVETIDEGQLEPVANTETETTTLEGGGETLQSSAGASTGLPSSAVARLSVINISQENADAMQSGARPGDVLRYEISLNSATDDVVNYIPVINVAGIDAVVEFTNTGFGVMENGNIVYPAYSHQAPCEQVFTFFVRVLEDCKEMTSLSVVSTDAGTVVVPLSCGLSETGPAQRWFLLAGMIMLLLTLMFSFSSRSKAN